jgi:putative transposase
MDDYESLSHTKWECKYHVVFIPKYRRKVLYGGTEGSISEMCSASWPCRRRAGSKKVTSCWIMFMISIPPKYAVSQVVGFIKGKSAIHLARTHGERKRNFVGQHFWARGYLCLERRSGRSGDTRVHQEPGARRQAPGPTQPVALIAAFRRLQQPGPRQRPQQPLRAAPYLKPPALPGDTYPNFPGRGPD